MTPSHINLNIVGVQNTEYAPLQAATRQLGRLLTTAAGSNINLKLTLARDIVTDGSATEPNLTIISLVDEMTANDVAFPDLANSCRERCSALSASTSQPVFVCTIFRHVPLRVYQSPGLSRAWLQERIRRINLLTAELSQATGIFVIDIDRIFVHFGARLLQTDYLMSGPRAAEVAGDVIAGALLSEGLDHATRPDWLEAARQLHGGLAGITERLRTAVSV